MIKDLLRFGSRHRLPLIHQTEAAECGLACLAMVASFHGHRLDLNTLRRRHPISIQGLTLRGLMEIARHLDLTCRALRFELSAIAQLKLPAVLHWDMNHFVVLREVRRSGIVIHDPAFGERTIPLDEASKHVTGVALEVAPAEGFKQQEETASLPFSVFLKQTGGLFQPLAQIFALSGLLEILIVVSPFYMQLAVDEVIARGDADLLTVLALGFGLLSVITVATTTLRAHVLLFVQNAVQFQLGSRLFHHLLRLPLSWFEKRHVGDILSRFGSLEPIRNLLAEGLIVSIVDGLMAIITLAMIVIYSPKLAAVVLVALVFYAALRLALFRMFRERSDALIQARAHESSYFIETVRAIQCLKLFNREMDREGQWLNRYSDVVNANIRLGRARITFQSLNGLIFGLENILTVYLASRLALDNVLTVGMVFAFMSYKKSFTDKMIALIERGIDLRLLSLHLDRLSDIALSPLEKGHDTPLSYMRHIQGGIELRDVSFRYSETDRYVLEKVNLKVEPGEFITITGPSGTGKTTLMKIMLGLLEPTSGEVLVDGVPLAVVGLRAYREQVAAVMQDDQLLSGSIADNICFFDSGFDEQRMTTCAAMAGLHDDIMMMPMTYNSLIGDMGSSLSGGQKQRLLLARALYRLPKILFMDEGTAHLDLGNEAQINQRLRQLSITRISIAHRPGMAEGADRVVTL